MEGGLAEGVIASLAALAVDDGAAVGLLQPFAKDQGDDYLNAFRLLSVRPAFNFTLTCSLSGVLRRLGKRNLAPKYVRDCFCVKIGVFMFKKWFRFFMHVKPN